MTNYKPQYYGPAATGHRWIFSYADVLTILLILFVAIAAQDLRKAEARSRPAPAAVSEANPAGKSVTTEPDRNLQRAQQLLEERGLNPKLEPRGLVVALPEEVLFPSGEDRLSPSALPVVGQVAGSIRDIPNKVLLVGHADSVPIHNRRFRDNWALSVARGLRLLEVLSRDHQIPQSRLSVAGFGSYSPRLPNDTRENRASNRRVEIVILREAEAPHRIP